jgi:hypothetical protein
LISRKHDASNTALSHALKFLGKQKYSPPRKRISERRNAGAKMQLRLKLQISPEKKTTNIDKRLTIHL